jgi:outer membrane protein OmpA-like peptidoglycan-associated protein
MMKKFILVLAITACASSFAQPIKNASVDQLVEHLAGPEEPKTRSLRNLKPEPRSIDLVIQFDFDSSKLQDSSKPLLDNLVSAMKTDRLMNVRFLVEGHTDAKGSLTYNQNLSTRRAESVVNYMTDMGIDKSRMESIGKGFSELLYSEKPQAMENRRVRITTLQ